MVVIVTLYLLNNIYNIWLPSNQSRVVNMTINQTSFEIKKKRREPVDKNKKYLALVLTIVHAVCSIIP